MPGDVERFHPHDGAGGPPERDHGLVMKRVRVDPDVGHVHGETIEGARSRESTAMKLGLAYRLVELGKLSPAEELLRQIECVWGLLRYAGLKGELLLAQGDAKGALAYLRVAHMRQLAGGDAGLLTRRESEYGRCLALSGRGAEAEAVLLRAYARSAEWCGPESGLIHRVIGWIADLYEASGRQAAAAEWRRREEERS
jgi:hypothetical protein